ncbi:MAG TPA: ion transporter [Myxococcota bacterium]|jgi:voltage-gated potassium channel|nr:ion transporter [Myxococcota bacterium]
MSDKARGLGRKAAARLAHQPSADLDKPAIPWRRRLYEVIFEAETPAGKAFDVGLFLCIVLSVAAVLLESIAGVRRDFGEALTAIEWVFTVLFSIEYTLRMLAVRRPARYAFSFFGIVDFLAIVPSYLSLFVAGTSGLMVVRVFRLLRVFRVFKLTRHLAEAGVLMRALVASRHKITVFLSTVILLVVTMGTVMYFLEGPASGFTSIPRGIYWAIVTMTTVGYGDIAPQTIPGQMVAAAVMILGYGIIAVPTGIVTLEMAIAAREADPNRARCPRCDADGHRRDARFCHRCGARLADDGMPAA